MLGSTLSNDPLADKRFDFQFVNPPCIGDNSGNGYIWSTTGSGKTLTSFNASTLLKDNPDIEKCLFVVDRKDLDRQTREEFAPPMTINALN